MGYICHYCKNHKGNEVRNLHIVATRDVTYIIGENKMTTGWEIAKEVPVCNGCLVLSAATSSTKEEVKNVVQRGRKGEVVPLKQRWWLDFKTIQ